MFKCVQCFIEFWKDFHADQKWKFPDSPPSQFKKRLELNRLGINLSEFERAKWFWRRRPNLILGEGLPGYLLVVFVGVLLLFIPPSELCQERRRQLLEEALNRLPAKFREVLILFEIERWSYKAIAAALNVRLGTVMSRLNRARRRLQQELTQVRDSEIGEEL
jgi:RNA polymerase sigma factor (sigma-70 family)